MSEGEERLQSIPQYLGAAHLFTAILQQWKPLQYH